MLGDVVYYLTLASAFCRKEEGEEVVECELTLEEKCTLMLESCDAEGISSDSKSVQSLSEG